MLVLNRNAKEVTSAYQGLKYIQERRYDMLDLCTNLGLLLNSEFVESREQLVDNLELILKFSKRLSRQQRKR